MAAIEYSAFLSYSRKDEVIGAKIEKDLQKFRIPREDRIGNTPVAELLRADLVTGKGLAFYLIPEASRELVILMRSFCRWRL